MPELPEVETTLRGILPHIQNQKINKVTVRHYGLRWPILSDIQTKLKNKKVTSIERRAKYLIFKLDSGNIILHLGMSGRLRILEKKTPAQKHDHIDIEFANKKILRFTDPRRFGAFIWTDENPLEHKLLASLGPEPLDKIFTGKCLFSRAENKNIAIKNFIMNNQNVVGVGNIYATEALFLAGVHPQTPAKLVSQIKLQKLVLAIKKVLRRAIQKGGTTLKDFLSSDGKPGYFSNELKVYGRSGKPCVNCDSILKSSRIGQRNTVYCASCQK